MTYKQKDIDNFFKAVDSLKKYRRAELFDEKGNNLLDNLYTDLLPNNQIIKTCLANNTTFLIGRKGTGKSTIFLKLQHELRKQDNKISCYIDTKTIFENSQAEFINLDYLNDVIPQDILNNYLIQRTFIQSILKEIQKELNTKSNTFIEKCKKILNLDNSQTVKKYISDLASQIENNETLKSIEIPIIKQVTTKTINEDEFNNSSESKSNIDTNVQLSFDTMKTGIKTNTCYNHNESNKKGLEIQNNFTSIFLKLFQIKDIIEKIKEILSIMKINTLVILLDDFSEIDDSAIKTFINVLLAPLNNWSDDFIKFKVAAYPDRIPFGKIDHGKIDIIDLDFYNLYSEFDRDKMEIRSIEFTKKLLTKRIEYFTKKAPEYFFDISPKDTLESYYELLFQISMNVPRIIGYILFYCYNSNLLFKRPITKIAIEAAAQKYYEQAIEPFFNSTTYSLMAIDEKISTLQFKELLNLFIDNLKSVKKRVVSGDLSGQAYNKTNPHTSHFYFIPEYEKFIKTLELNFFITKYNEMSDRDACKVSIYALNYGLCKKANLRWGKPENQRKYFIERPFNSNKIIHDFLQKSKKICCTNQLCNKTYSMDHLKFLEFNKMRCPECQSLVSIIGISDSIQKELEKIDSKNLLPNIEYTILYEINKAGNPLRPKEIAEELDCSHQLIGKKAKILDENRGLLTRSTDSSGNRLYSLTSKSIEIYFSKDNL